MELFKINQDLTYENSPIAEKNLFVNMSAESEELPKHEDF
jgi:hypothetical protein